MSAADGVNWVRKSLRKRGRERVAYVEVLSLLGQLDQGVSGLLGSLYMHLPSCKPLPP